MPGVRPNVGTYGRYDYEALGPPDGVRFDGSFEWLRAEPPLRGHGIIAGVEKKVAEDFRRLEGDCLRKGVALPACFRAFMRDRNLAGRVRSCTDCQLDVAPEVIESPKGDGWVVRFLADSQGCLFWYVFLPRGREGHCVVVAPAYYGADAAEVWPEPREPEEMVFCSPDFESFVFRFWLENEYWFASNGYGAPSAGVTRWAATLGWPALGDGSGNRGWKGWWRRWLGR